jgi:hypothetical protein
MSLRASARILIGVLALPTVLLAGACEKAPAPPRNDNLAKAFVLSSIAQGHVTGTTVRATRQPKEPQSIDPATVWYRWTAPDSGAVIFSGASGFPVVVEAYTGAVLGQLRAASSGSFLEATGFRVTKHTVYAIRVSSFAASTFALKWAMAAPPTNNQRASAAAVSGASGSVLSDTTAATAESTDPRIDGYRLPATVWYRWTAPATGWFSFDTHGSNIDTALGVYTDENPLQLLDDSSGNCGGLNFSDVATASVGFAATAGSDYLLVVGGTSSDSSSSSALGGPVQLNWHPQAIAPVASGNDAFASPATIRGAFGFVAGSTAGATSEPGEPAHAGAPARSSVWFSWTPPVTANYVLGSVPGDLSGCPARLDIYRGNALSSLTRVPSAYSGQLPAAQLVGDSSASSDSSGIDFSASPAGARVHLIAGTTYRVAVDRYGESGPFTLQWDIPQAKPLIRSATAGNGSIGVIWAPPARTAGSARTAYFVAAFPANSDAFEMSEPQTLPVTSAFTTIRGLRNGTAYRIIVAAVNSSGLGDPAVSRPVTPRKLG